MIVVAACGHLVGALCLSIDGCVWCPICQQWQEAASIVVREPGAGTGFDLTDEDLRSADPGRRL